nr:leucine-rich repeat-containing protein 27 isoform X4 [Globicephala melas]
MSATCAGAPDAPRAPRLRAFRPAWRLRASVRLGVSIATAWGRQLPLLDCRTRRPGRAGVGWAGGRRGNRTVSGMPSARFLSASLRGCLTSPGCTSALMGSQRCLLGSAATKREPNEEAIHSQEAEGTMVTEKAGFFPPVGKLDLRECRRSAEPPEDWPSEEEIRRFWKLRQEIVENQQAEVLERQRLPAELPPALTAVLSDKEKRRPRPRPVFRTRTPSFKSVLPELAPWQQTQGRTGLPEESIGPDGAAQERQASTAGVEGAGPGGCRGGGRGSATSRPHGGTWSGERLSVLTRRAVPRPVRSSLCSSSPRRLCPGVQASPRSAPALITAAPHPCS